MLAVLGVILAVLGVILAVGYVGGSLPFVLARRVLRRPLLAALARIGIGEARVEALAERFRRSGARGVAVARMTPGVRIASIAAAGLAAISFAAFLAGLVAGNGVFVAAHFALGYLLGASAWSWSWPSWRRSVQSAGSSCDGGELRRLSTRAGLTRPLRPAWLLRFDFELADRRHAWCSRC